MNNTLQTIPSISDLFRMEHEAKKIEDFVEKNLKAPIDFETSDKLENEKIDNQLVIPSIKYKERPRKGKANEIKLGQKQKTKNLF